MSSLLGPDCEPGICDELTPVSQARPVPEPVPGPAPDPEPAPGRLNARLAALRSPSEQLQIHVCPVAVVRLLNLSPQE